jgi:glyoxylase-like metal-dependent hydrolase (beta-lactamase superfamily II)
LAGLKCGNFKKTQSAKVLLDGAGLKIVDGVHQVSGVDCNVFLDFYMDKIVVIDTGLPGNSKKNLGYIEKLGYKPTDVTTIVLTHHHIDHVGNLKKIREATNAKVAAHELDASIIAGEKAAPKTKSLLVKALSAIVKPSPVKPDIILKDNDKIEGLLVIHLPGHTEGSIALLDVERKVMFVGDALRFVDDKIQLSPEHYTLDPVKAKESVGKIASFDFDVLVGGHGQTLMPQASQKIKSFYETLKK